MRGKKFKAGARREEGKYPHGSWTDEQRNLSLQDLPPFWLSHDGTRTALLLSHRALLAMLLRRALSSPRHDSAHPFLFMRGVPSGTIYPSLGAMRTAPLLLREFAKVSSASAWFRSSRDLQPGFAHTVEKVLDQV